MLKHSLLSDFTDNACFRIDESLRMIEISLERIDEATLWKKPNSSLSSIGNLLLHVSGNMQQYVLSGIGNQKDTRDRNSEFNTTGTYTKKELITRLRSTLDLAKKEIAKTSENDYLKIRSIQGFKMSGIGAVLHAVEHLSYHTGKIVFWVKLLRDQDLGFYKDIDLTITDP